MTKTTALIDKGRPELGRAANVGAGKLGSRANLTPTPRNPARQSIEAQMGQTSKAIKENLRRIANLVQRSQWDRAGQVSEIVARQRMRLYELAKERQARLDASPYELDKDGKKVYPEPNPKQSKSPTKTQVKTKRYKRWAEK